MTKLYTTAEAAHEALSRGSEKTLAACMEENLEANIAASGRDDLAVSDVEVVELGDPDAGDEARFFEFSWTHTGPLNGEIAGSTSRANPETTRVYVYSLKFRSGRAVGFVETMGLGKRPVQSMLRPLAQRIAHRMSDDPPPKD